MNRVLFVSMPLLSREYRIAILVKNYLSEGALVISFEGSAPIRAHAAEATSDPAWKLLCFRNPGHPWRLMVDEIRADEIVFSRPVEVSYGSRLFEGVLRHSQLSAKIGGMLLFTAGVVLLAEL